MTIGLPRPAINLTPPVFQTSSIYIGLNPVLSTGTYSKPTEKLYSLYRDGNIIHGYDKVSYSTLVSYTWTTRDIGPMISIKEHPLVGGRAVFANSGTFDHQMHLSQSAIWTINEGVTTEMSAGIPVIQSWQSTYGGLNVLLSSTDINRSAIYNATGSLIGTPAAIFDGVDDEMFGMITKGSSWTDGEYAVIAHRISFSTLGDTWIGQVSSPTIGRYNLADRTAAILYNAAGQGSLLASGGGNDPDFNLQRWWANRNQSLTYAALGHGAFIDNESSSFTNLDTFPDGEFVCLGGRNNGACANIAAIGADFSSWLEPDARLHLRALQSYLSKVEC